MRILFVHNRYLYRGGEDASHESEMQLLRERGDDVLVYEESNTRIAELGALRAAARTLWSRDSYRRVDALIRDHRPDLMHVQNFFPLISPSVYYAARKHGIPVVQSLRNYRLICLGGQLLRKGRVCEDCLGKWTPWPGVLHACYRGSHAASAVAGMMLYAHTRSRTWTRKVTTYIALTDFVRRKFVEAGFPEDRIVVKPNFLVSDPGVGDAERTGAVYVGRLSPEKGVDTLIDAWKRAGLHEPLRVIGDGPDAARLAGLAQDAPSVRLMGARPAAEVFRELKRARYLVFPSIWYETFGRTILEAFATGTPVLASRLGAAAELVEHEGTGLLFETGNVQALANALQRAHADTASLAAMGRSARHVYENKYTADRNYALMMQIYQDAIRRCA